MMMMMMVMMVMKMTTIMTRAHDLLGRLRHAQAEEAEDAPQERLAVARELLGRDHEDLVAREALVPAAAAETQRRGRRVVMLCGVTITQKGWVPSQRHVTARHCQVALVATGGGAARSETSVSQKGWVT